jgi:putative selenium metabolism hydrolase
MLEEKRKKELTQLCQRLVRIKSYSGEEKGMVDELKKVFEEFKFDDYKVDSYGNILGHIKGKKPGTKILFDAHVDTVPVGDPSKWTVDPFGGEIKDGRIYGRGTSDMKGQLSAMIAAASYFAEDFDRDFEGDIYVSGVVHEEMFEGIASSAISSAVNPDLVVIGESSELNVKIGQRGRAEVVIETFGKPAHSANPEKGVNAVYKMSKIIEKVQDINPPEDPALGKGILVLTDIKSLPYPGASVVPEYCRATFDRRTLVGETKETVLEPIKKVIKELSDEDPDLKAEVSYSTGEELCYTGETIRGERFFPAWVIDEKDEYVFKAVNGIKEAGIVSGISNYSFCTNGSHYAGEKGIKTIGFGPSRENLAHTIDEYIEEEQLYFGEIGYYGILKSMYNK